MLTAEIDVRSSSLSTIHLSNAKRIGNTLCNVGLLSDDTLSVAFWKGSRSITSYSVNVCSSKLNEKFLIVVDTDLLICGSLAVAIIVVTSLLILSSMD